MKYFTSLLFLLCVCNSYSQELGFTRRDITNHLSELINDTTRAECTTSYNHEDDKIIAFNSCSGDTVFYTYYLTDDGFGEICDRITMDYKRQDCLVQNRNDILEYDFENYIQVSEQKFICESSNGWSKVIFTPKQFMHETIITSVEKGRNPYRITLYFELLTRKELKKIKKTTRIK